jgi:SAM-dependent methyltransferase
MAAGPSTACACVAGLESWTCACGSGASAIPAAEIVGPDGFVLGVDLAEGLLAMSRAKASSRGLGNVEFHAGDMLDLGLPAHDFDAVICVFGIFFSRRGVASARKRSRWPGTARRLGSPVSACPPQRLWPRPRERPTRRVSPPGGYRPCEIWKRRLVSPTRMTSPSSRG